MSTYEISKSSLLSLKAEILRKRDELSKIKVENEVKKKVLKNNPLDIKNKGVEEREKFDQTEENEDLLKQSRSILEHKARLYDKLSSEKPTAENRARNKQFLVRFDKKQSSVPDLPPDDDSEPDDKRPESEEEFYDSEDDDNKNPEEKWVDYVDCLGRTRRCMQKDLQDLKAKDDELSKIVDDKNKKQHVEFKTTADPTPTEEIETKSDNSDPNDAAELLSNDMRREMLRQQWEKEEDELLHKSDIHYQDLLFGEARSHGVGYYGFSKDEEERRKQQEALKKLRVETETKQKKAQELKNSREKLLAARLKAARNRKRARMGLPPEEDEPEPTDKQSEEAEKPEEQKVTEDDKERERLLSEARKNHVRPWDVGKEGVKEREVMSQKEWVEKQRKERPKEFAPPSTSRKDFRSRVNAGNEDMDINKSLKFTTKKHSNSETVYDKSCVEESCSSSMQPVPIHDLDVSNDEDISKRYEGDKKKNTSSSYSDTERRGVEIAPPTTYDYYGPSQSKVRRTDVKQPNIHDSIEAGLKFLRKQIEEKENSSKRDDEAFLF
ncbi:unnamed protein product [Phyllotreta striolata]|uniref:CCDC174 alpha/beta GRSR domain-containing protein n=1 Tax=Phyllotreta striolata TaxID=444603 RepID=A0A9N9TGH0_PHYSR|nr:unnamed protein product [Phyllotreta striolata]